jgi:DsbC/DsbD-like thiol-disulfide interchange protein
MRAILASFLLLATSVPALAGATPWQDVASGARLRLISSDIRQPQGTTLVGLELAMPDNFTTYWRLPGETGIPTSVDITGSTGLAAPVIEWPYPAPDTANGFLDFVYRGNTVLPIELKTSGNSSLLKVNVVMGVCSDVCVPVRASFSLPLSFASADAGQSLRLQQAEALAPIPWNGAGPAFSAASFDAAGRTLRIRLADAAVDPTSVIASTGDPTVIFGTPQKSPDGHSILLPLRAAGHATDWLKKPVQLTFMTAMGSFEESEQVTASSP